MFVLSLAPSIIAIVGILASIWLQNLNNMTQREISLFEITFPERQQAYSTFMTNLDSMFSTAPINGFYSRDCDETIKIGKQVQLSSFRIEPFLREEARDSFMVKSTHAVAYALSECNKNMSKEKFDDEALKNYHHKSARMVSEFRTLLFTQLYSLGTDHSFIK